MHANVHLLVSLLARDFAGSKLLDCAQPLAMLGAHSRAPCPLLYTRTPLNHPGRQAVHLRHCPENACSLFCGAVCKFGQTEAAKAEEAHKVCPFGSHNIPCWSCKNPVKYSALLLIPKGVMPTAPHVSENLATSLDGLHR